MRLIHVEDPSDDRLAPFRDIRERDLRRRDGLLVAEGTVVLRALLGSEDFEPIAALVLDARLDGCRPILDRAPSDLPVYVVPRPVIDTVAGFPMHRGVLAVARRRRPSEPAVLLQRPGPAVIACGIANHDNAGAILRNASAFGAACVLFDETSCDPLYRKAIRVSAGAAFAVPHHRGGRIGELVEAATSAGFRPLALSPRGSRTIRASRNDGPTALVLGTEGEGLPRAILDRLETARIPMRPDHDSLNVAVASAIALYELTSG